jgi:FKBP-type peptidyl-prolyl cis-trans isomerase
MSDSRIRRPIHMVLLCALALGRSSLTGAADPQSRKTAPQPAPDSSYQVGLMLGEQLEHNGLGLQKPDDLIRGLKEGLTGRRQTPHDREATLRYMRDAHEALADSNRTAAREFLARNTIESGVRTLPSGLQYRVLADGDPSGEPPSSTDQVTVRYRTSLPDGKELDRSELHDRPATFKVNSVFRGWQEALKTMNPGAKWQLFVPPELGYGANTPPGVPPGSLLIYELELLKIEPAPPLDPQMLRRGSTAAPNERPPQAGSRP